MLSSILRDSDFLFVVMPWAFPNNPVLGASVLQEVLAENDLDSQIAYPIFDMIRQTGNS